jgi:beta-glucosidase-like glycosyl hydrolase
MTGAPGDDDISEETRHMVSRIRERAAATPGTPEIADLIDAAAARAGEMSAAEIRALGRDTLILASQVSYLLGRLAAVAGEEAGP